LQFQKSLFIWIGGFLLILLIAVVDLFTGYQLSFSIFYFIPIMWITWKTGRTGGIISSVFSAIAWLEADLLAEHFYTHAIIPYWNATMRMGMFILVAFILSALKKSLDNEKQNSRTDHLTRLANSRSFLEFLEQETQRAKRYGQRFSVAYIDIDNFKFVNDTLGHHAGDELLQKIAATIRETTRQTDIVGRMGGDEFCILLPMTDQNKAKEVLQRLNKKIEQLFFLKQYKITFSMGCITFHQIPDTIDEIIQRADDLMYQVKKTGKNNIQFSIFDDSQ